jgi:hypothetical protein
LSRDSPPPAFEAFSRVGAIAIGTMGAAVLLGWFLNVQVLERVIPGIVAMKANTACCFLACGLALHLIQGRRQKPWPQLARPLAAVVVTVALVTLAEYLTGSNWGIDELLFRDNPGAIATSQPGRMAPATAVSFVFVGLALIASRKRRASGRLARWLAAPAFLIAGLVLIGYSYGVSQLYAVPPYSSIALHTAIGILVLSMAIIAAQPADGFMAVLTGDTAGGITARRLLPATALILFILGWIRLAGQRAGFYDTSFGVALLVASSIMLTSGLVAWHTRALHAADMAREGVDAEILALNDTLEQRVNERTASLREAITQVQQLGGMLPICAWCKKIRDDKDYWHSVEGYISTHSEARFTHGVCPDCHARLLREGRLTG